MSYSKDSDGLYTLTKRSDNRIDLNENTFNATSLEIKSGTSAMKIFETDDTMPTAALSSCCTTATTTPSTRH